MCGRRIKLELAVKKTDSKRSKEGEDSEKRAEGMTVDQNVATTQLSVIEKTMPTASLAATIVPPVKRSSQILIFGIPSGVNNTQIKIAVNKCARKVLIERVNQVII